MTAKTFHGFLVRILALALALVGAVLLSAGLVGNAEAEITVTVHADTRVVHEPDTRSPPPTFGDIIMEAFDMTTIYNAMVACMEEEERAGETRILDSGLNCIPLRSSAPPEFLDGENGEYPADLCARLGGDVEYVRGQGVCQNIDTSGTFCFMGAPEVFPCRGLYKSVTHCNHFNRPGKNPFACGRNCPKGQFACGSKCWSGEISSTGRIPYVVPRHGSFYGYVGDVFRVAATLRAGEARFSLSSSIFTVGAADGMLATVGTSAPLAEGAEYAATLRADFACNGLSNTPAHAEWAFTVTALAAVQPATVYLEGGEGTGVGTVTISGIGQLSFAESSPLDDVLDIRTSGEIYVRSQRPAIGTDRTFRVESTSPEFVGTITLTVVVKFRHPFDSDLGASHCSVPADSDYRALRRNACPTVAVNDYCPALDDDLLNALETKGVRGDSDFCAALRSGANVSAPNPERDYPYPMAAAAKGGSVARGRTLTLHGASDVNSQHGDALNYAALAGSAEFAEWLIVTVGASVNRKSGADNQYAPVLMLGMRDLSDSGDSAAVARLLTAYNVSADAESDFVADGATLPYRYISHLTDPGGAPDHHSLLPLLEHGMDPHYPHPGGEDEGLRPLSRALKYNYAKVVSVLLVDGGDLVDPSRPDLNNDDPEKRTPPIFRVRTPEAVELLATVGADLNASIKVDNIGGARVYVTAMDFLVINFLETENAATLSLAIDRLRELGGECRLPSDFVQANPLIAALCGYTDGESSSSGDASGQGASGEGVCDSPWALNLGESGFYLSSCGLECPAGSESGEWYCGGFADIYDDSGELDSSALENVRSQCETQAASSESGLSCR